MHVRSLSFCEILAAMSSALPVWEDHNIYLSVSIFLRNSCSLLTAGASSICLVWYIHPTGHSASPLYYFSPSFACYHYLSLPVFLSLLSVWMMCCLFGFSCFQVCSWEKAVELRFFLSGSMPFTCVLQSTLSVFLFSKCGNIVMVFLLIFLVLITSITCRPALAKRSFLRFILCFLLQ